MATKRIVPEVDYPVTTIEFADGKRTLEMWEQEFATDEAAIAATESPGKLGRTLRQLTYQEWLDQVYSRFSVKSYLSARNLNSKRQLSRMPS